MLAVLAPELWRRWRAGGGEARAIAFAARATAAIVVFFTCSASKRPQYILPALVPLALLVAIACSAAPHRAVRIVRGFACRGGDRGLAAVTVAAGIQTGTGDLRFVTPAVVGAAGVSWSRRASSR